MLLNNLTKRSSVLNQKYGHILNISTGQADTESSDLHQSRSQIDSNQASGSKSIEDELAQFENNLRTLQGQRGGEAKTTTTFDTSPHSQGNHSTIGMRLSGESSSCPDKTTIATAGRFRRYNGTWIPKPMGSLITQTS